MTVAVIEVGPAQAPVVAALHARTVAADMGGAWDADWVARVLALPGAFAAVAEEGEPLGFALCLPAGEATDLVAIGVVPQRRRRGVGRRLLEHCLARAAAAGAARLMLEVAADNASAAAFYRAAGFTEVGRRPRYYRAGPGGAPRDALILAKSLSRGPNPKQC
jgi:ribosomal protein S18 acetylase RimI-like enzyme